MESANLVYVDESGWALIKTSQGNYVEDNVQLCRLGLNLKAGVYDLVINVEVEV